MRCAFSTLLPFSKEKNKRCKIAVIVSEYHKELTYQLLFKCQETLFENGIREQYLDIFWVPGCFEIPLAAKKLAIEGKHNVIIALGIVIKGDTHHFESIVNACTQGIMDVMLETGIPIVNEIIPAYKLADAKKRAKKDNKNKGIEAAVCALNLYHSKFFQGKGKRKGGLK